LVLFAALALTCLGQHLRLYSQNLAVDAAIFFGVGTALFGERLLRLRPALPLPPEAPASATEVSPRWEFLAGSLALAVVVWFATAGNRFTWQALAA
jgi:hypothetical protein